jgi:Xaa-Pro dipeptidase
MRTSCVVTETGPLVEALAFDRGEYERRLEAVRASLRERGLEAFLSWTPENILYLTGHDTPGYYYYQCCVVTHDHDPVVVARRIEATNTWGRSAYRHAAPYADTEDPVDRTLEVLEELGVAAATIGAEAEAWFVTPRRYRRLEELVARAGGTVVDASMLVEAHRVVKSPPELEYIRRGCRAADAAMAAAIEATRAGVSENDVAAAVWTALLGEGSGYAGLPPFIVSGRRSWLCHATWGGRVLEDGDMLHYELPGVFERYVGAVTRNGVVGRPTPELERAVRVNVEATQAVIDAIRPGAIASELHGLCHRTFADAGYGDLHLHRTGYSIGLNYAPDWGEGHIFSLIAGNDRPLEPNMTFHLVPGLRFAGEYSLGFSESVRVTESGCEQLTQSPRELFVR